MPRSLSLRIGIDACCWSNRRGYGRFTRELVSRMVAEHPRHEFVLVLDQRTAAAAALPEGARRQIAYTSEQPTRAASAEGARSPLDLLRLSRAASAAAADVFFFPAVYTFYPLLRRTPCVVTFHDTIAEDHPELIFPTARGRWLWRTKCWLARRQARRLLTVSEDAKSRIAAAFAYPAAAIDVITEGPGTAFRPLADVDTQRAAVLRSGLPTGVPLLLYVGGISPHKNLATLLEAVARIGSTRAWHLALVGDHESDSFYGCYGKLLEQRNRLGLEARVTFTGFVPDADLALLYNAASLLVLPSWAEGFGLPAVEAMACGLPVAASRRGSLPEVVGTAGSLFEPGDVGGMAAALARILEDAGLRERMRAEGLQRAAAYSWSRAAAETLSVLEGVARGR